MSDKKKKFRLADLFFEDDGQSEEKPKEDNKSQAKEVKSTSAPTTGTESPAIQPTTQNNTGSFDKAIYESLLGALESSNLDGFDYFEYKNAIEGMKDSIPDETTRFKAAFASATAMGVGKSRLVETARFYISVLDQEEKKFQEVLKQKEKTGLKTLEDELGGIDGQIQRKSEEIARLTKEIDELKARKVTLSQQVSENKSKLDGVKVNFYTTFDQIKQRILDDIKKMEDFLK